MVSDEFGTVPESLDEHGHYDELGRAGDEILRPHRRQRREEVCWRALKADMARERSIGWALKALTVSMAVRAVSMEEEALEVCERSCARRGEAKDWDRGWMRKRMGREARMTRVRE